MRRVIALIISIAMVASLATGLAISGFAEGTTFEYEGLMYEVLDEAEKTVAVVYSGTDATSGVPSDYPKTGYEITDTVNGYTVTSIGVAAFSDCTGLTSVIIGNNVTSIGNRAFESCNSLTNITIPGSVKTIGDNAFNGCTSLTSVTIPEGVTGIGKGAFKGCTGLTSVIIGNNVTSIGDSAFDGCTGLTSVIIGNNVTSIGNYAFRSCTDLTSVTITDNVIKIGSHVFENCAGLTSVIIGNNVTSIGNYAFQNCTGLTSITIPKNITSIAAGAFVHSALTTVTISAEDPPTATNAFYGCISLTDIIVPVNSIAKYKANPTWNSYKSFLKADSTTGIEINDKPIENCFDAYGASQLTVSGDTVTVNKISNTNNGDLTINIPKGKILKVSTTNINPNKTQYGIYSINGIINIQGKGELVIDTDGDGINAPGDPINIAETTINITTNSVGINANTNINITSNSNITVDSGGCGLAADNSVNIASGCVVKARTNSEFGAFYAKTSILIDCQPITQANIKNGILSNTNDYMFIIADSGEYAIVPYVEPIDTGIKINNTTLTNQNYANFGITLINNNFDYNSTTKTLTIASIITSTDTTITIPEGKTLKISSKDQHQHGIKVDGKLTIDGEGALDVDIENGTGYKLSIFAIFARNVDIKDGKIVLNVKTTSTNDENCSGIYATNNVTISGGEVIIKKAGGYGIRASKNVDITGGKVSIVSATNSGIYGIGGNVNISGNLTVVTVTDAGNHGIWGKSSINIKDKPSVSAKGKNAAYVVDTSGKIEINGTQITADNLPKYFDGENVTSTDGKEIKGTGLVTVKYPNPGPTPPPDPKNQDLEEEEQADPEIDIDLGFGSVRVKSSEKSLVMDEKRLIDKIAEELDGDKISFDLTKAYIADTKSTKDFDGIYFNNDIYKELGVIDKDIEINTRYAKAIVYTGKEVGNNPLSLHLTDVSKEQGKCATAIQKAAMETSKIYAEVNYSFVTNGKPTENEAKIYVPVSGPAKVFYLFNAEKIGIVPCEVIDGYCIFNRYYDGTYIVCAN